MYNDSFIIHYWFLYTHCMYLLYFPGHRIIQTIRLCFTIIILSVNVKGTTSHYCNIAYKYTIKNFKCCYRKKGSDSLDGKRSPPKNVYNIVTNHLPGNILFNYIGNTVGDNSFFKKIVKDGGKDVKITTNNIIIFQTLP